MAVGNFLLGTVRKKLGEIVFFRRGGQQISRARVRRIKNPQTAAQAAQRSRMNAIVVAFRFFDGVVFKRLRLGQSQYNAFVSSNLRAPRPSTFAPGVNAIYETSFPFLVPPTPRNGLGSGLPVNMPYAITRGRLSRIRFGAAPSFFPIGDIVIGRNDSIVTTTESTQSLIVKFDVKNISGTIMAALGQIGKMPTAGTAGSVDLSGKEVEYVVNFCINGNRFIHTGVLGSFFNTSDAAIEYTQYNEIGDIVSGLGTVFYDSSGQVMSFVFTITNSEGENFNGGINMTNQSFGIFFTNMLIRPGYAVDVAAIASRRQRGQIQVSDSDLLLAIGESDVYYQSLFTQEVTDEAIRDFQNRVTGADGLNLGLSK